MKTPPSITQHLTIETQAIELQWWANANRKHPSEMCTTFLFSQNKHKKLHKVYS